MTATPETTPYQQHQQHQPHDAGPTALAPEGAAAGEGREALPQAAPADAWKKRPFFRGHRALRRALAPALGLGLAVFVGLGGYAWQRANPTQAQALGTPAAAATGAATPASGTVPLTLSRAQDDPPDAFTPAPLRPKARGRHGYRHRPPARPTFWQRLFGRLFGHNAQNQPS
jgi:hypothetical protein